MTHIHSLPKEESQSSAHGAQAAEGDKRSWGAEAPLRSAGGTAATPPASEEAEGELREGHTADGGAAESTSSHNPSEEPLPTPTPERRDSVEGEVVGGEAEGRGPALPAAVGTAPPSEAQELSSSLPVAAAAAAAASAPWREADTPSFVPPPYAPPPYTVTEQPLPAPQPLHPRDPPPPYYASHPPTRARAPRTQRRGHYGSTTHGRGGDGRCIDCAEQNRRDEQCCTDEEKWECFCLMCRCLCWCAYAFLVIYTDGA